jgi:hypothetical protein
MSIKPQVGELWRAKVSAKVVTVRVDAVREASSYSGRRSLRYQSTNLSTGRRIDVHRNRLRERLDVVVTNEGTIIAFRALNDDARAVLEETIGHAPRLGPQYCVEHRYARDVAHGLQSDHGLVLVSSAEVSC